MTRRHRARAGPSAPPGRRSRVAQATRDQREERGAEEQASSRPVTPRGRATTRQGAEVLRPRSGEAPTMPRPAEVYGVARSDEPTAVSTKRRPPAREGAAGAGSGRASRARRQPTAGRRAPPPCVRASRPGADETRARPRGRCPRSRSPRAGATPAARPVRAAVDTARESEAAARSLEPPREGRAGRGPQPGAEGARELRNSASRTGG